MIVPPVVRSKLSQSLVLMGTLLVMFGYVHQRSFDGPTPTSRLDLLQAIVNDHSLDITQYGRNTPDVAMKNGRLYSDKAPGTVALALPGFAMAAVLGQAAGMASTPRQTMLVESWIASFFSQGLPATLGAIALWWWLARFVGQRSALITVLGVFIGGMPLPYCTMLFSHSQVVGLLCIALWASGLGLKEGCSPQSGNLEGKRRGQTLHNSLAGFCCGLAVASEYTAALVATAIGLATFHFRRSHMRAWLFGAVPPLLLIPAYSWATIGSPFSLPYSYQASFPEMSKGLYAIQYPDLNTLLKLTFLPTRGLFFWSPFLLMAALGYRELFKRSRCLFYMTLVTPLMQIVVISGRTWDWQAGPTIGPRYLAPILPLLALPCALAVQRFPKMGVALAIYSIEIMTLATLTDACHNASVFNPLMETVLPDFAEPHLSFNLGESVLGLPPFVSVALFYLVLVMGISWLWHRLPEDGAVSTPVEPNSGSNAQLIMIR